MELRAVHALAAGASLLLALPACLEPKTIVCDSGNLCPPGMKCVTADALALNGKLCINVDCGDGVVNKEAGEECDDGIETADCTATCKKSRCGDGYRNTAAGEECDDSRESATCNADCTLARCGDGKVNRTAQEQCDDEGESATCNADCTIARCGDGKLNKTAGEKCDDEGESATCNSDCTLSACGDGKLNKAAGEQCDDGRDDQGKVKETATCNSDCTIARCGDRKVNNAAGEQCDDGQATKTCNANCMSATCGDGVVDKAGGEECDDRGESASCNDDCSVARCGDGKVNKTAGEQCDGRGESAACNADCTLRACGDGKVNRTAGEQCDDGGESATCNPDCTVARCGDGEVNRTAGEQCDDQGESSACNADCSLDKCGDGKLNKAAGEQCDDGGESATCNADCTLSRCGDGKLNRSAGEACDDGNTDDNDDCLNTCVRNRCGDGVLDLRGKAVEVCDQGAKNGAAACDYGTATCEVCSADCRALSARTGPTCGDGIVNGAEVCDDGNALGCGTCSAGCDAPVVPAAATGTITPAPQSELGDGETFTLDDGVDPPVVFELDVAGDGAARNRVVVDVSFAVSAADVGVAIQRAIASVHPALRIRATDVDPATGAVALRNDLPGSFGNRTIFATVQSSSFVVAGMSGGQAHGCQGGAGCAAAADCAPRTACVASRCQDASFRLAVLKTEAGASGGSVAADVGAIACGSTCADELPAGTLVVLTATPKDASSAFAGWSGACTGTGDCFVIMDAGKTLTAQFVPVVLEVALSGAGAGKVVSSGGEIDCGSTCSAAFTRGADVTLTAVPGTGSAFSGWSGDCAGAAPSCTLTMDGPMSVTAAFGIAP